MNSLDLVDGAHGAIQLEQLLKGKRLTPAHRRVVQILVSRGAEVGFMSSMELANLAHVSQPSMTRFATALGFKGFTEMRNYFRSLSKQDNGAALAPEMPNKYADAIAAEAANIAALARSFDNQDQIQAIGKLLAASTPLAVLGLRASVGLAQQFAYYAAKVHRDVRPITNGGSMLVDQLEQARQAGASCLLAFALPLYPRETINAIKQAKDLGLKVVVVADTTFQYQKTGADLTLTGSLHSGLVFDSCATAAVLMAILLDAMCDALPDSEERLEQCDYSSSQRKVFERS
jgi:DNA-binding MurR/RpiR family transcriptional regulator